MFFFSVSVFSRYCPCARVKFTVKRWNFLFITCNQRVVVIAARPLGFRFVIFRNYISTRIVSVCSKGTTVRLWSVCSHLIDIQPTSLPQNNINTVCIFFSILGAVKTSLVCSRWIAVVVVHWLLFGLVWCYCCLPSHWYRATLRSTPMVSAVVKRCKHILAYGIIWPLPYYTTCTTRRRYDVYRMQFR